LAINAKGGESIKPKAKGPHHHFKIFKNYFTNVYFNWYLSQFSIGILFSFRYQVRMKNFNLYNIIWYPFQKGKIISKTLLKAKGRIISGGAFI
jgi:hypothetical protein